MDPTAHHTTMNSTSYNPLAPSNGVKELLESQNKYASIYRPSVEQLGNGHSTQMSGFTNTGGLNSVRERNTYDLTDIVNNKVYLSH